PLARASFAAGFDVEVIGKLLIGTASGWLQRLVRPVRRKQILLKSTELFAVEVGIDSRLGIESRYDVIEVVDHYRFFKIERIIHKVARQAAQLRRSENAFHRCLIFCNIESRNCLRNLMMASGEADRCRKSSLSFAEPSVRIR